MWWVCTAPPLLTRCRATCQLTSVVPGRRAASPAACWGRSAWSVCCIENMWDRWAEGRADRCVSDIWTGVLQLSASGDLPANDWSTVAGRGPGQSGAIHAAAACPLRLLSVSVPRAEGGARCTHAAVTTACCNGNGDSALPWRPHAVVTTMTHCHDNRLFAVAMSTCCCNNTHTLPWQQPLAVRTTPNPAMATTTTRCHDNDTATYHCYYVNSRTNDDQSNKYLNQSQSQHDSSHTLTPPPLIPAATHTHTHCEDTANQSRAWWWWHKEEVESPPAGWIENFTFILYWTADVTDSCQPIRGAKLCRLTHTLIDIN